MRIFRKITKFQTPLIALVVFVIVFTAVNAFVIYELNNIKSYVSKINSDFSKISEDQNNFKKNFEEELFNDHLAILERNKLTHDLNTLQSQLEQIKTDDELTKVEEIYSKFQDFQAKITRNQKVKVETKESEEKLTVWGTKLLNKEFEALNTEIDEQVKKLDADYQKYIAALPKPGATGEGYSYTTVNIDQGSFGVYLIKVPLSSVKVKTVAAITSDCRDNCPTKSLADYVKEAGGYAGMNGAYACPPDYASCAGKVNSFDFAFYNSNSGTWINKNALTWFKTGMFTFSGSSSNFYKETSDYDGDSVSGAISNFPSLLEDRNVVVFDGDMDSYQRDVKALRGAIGVGDDTLYLALITRATVVDAAYVMHALGAKHALNLDGGGTAAMYINGRYAVGPGRSLTNAIVLTK